MNARKRSYPNKQPNKQGGHLIRRKKISLDDDDYKPKQDEDFNMVLRSRTKRKVWTNLDEEDHEEESERFPKRPLRKLQNKEAITKRAPFRGQKPIPDPPEVVHVVGQESFPTEAVLAIPVEMQPSSKRMVSPSNNFPGETEDDEAAISLMGLANIVLTMEKEDSRLSPAVREPMTVTPLEESKINPNKARVFQNKNNSVPHETYIQVPRLDPPSFSCFHLQSSNDKTSSVEPNLDFNSKRCPFKRCSTHVAIAYYIFYDQRYQVLKGSETSTCNTERNLPKKFSPTYFDPTHEARLLKEKKEKLCLGSSMGQHKLLSTSYSTQSDSSGRAIGMWGLSPSYSYGMHYPPPALQTPYQQQYLPAYTNYKCPPPKDSNMTLPPVKNITRGKDESTVVLDRNVSLFPKMAMQSTTQKSQLEVTEPSTNNHPPCNDSPTNQKPSLIPEGERENTLQHKKQIAT